MVIKQDSDSIISNVAVTTLDDCGDEIIGSYTSWLEKHPSALENFDTMMSEANGKKVLVFLDYDGTLSQIVSDPDLAFMTDAMREAVGEVALCFPTAIISGRCREKVLNFVQLKDVYYAGSHGMDISTPLGSLKYSDHKHQVKSTDEMGNEVVNFHPAQEYESKIQEIIEAINVDIKDIEGAMVEDNKFCVSVHYRQVANEKDIDTLKIRVENLMKDYSNFKISTGKKVLEIRPNIDWDKGRALKYLLETFGFDQSDDKVFPIYIGDDKTDEDAFTTIHRIGRGIPIVVSSIPKKTSAKHSLRDPTEVMSFLIRLVEWKASWSSSKLNIAQ